MLIQEAHTKLYQFSQRMTITGIPVAVIYCGNEITIQCPKFVTYLVSDFIESNIKSDHKYFMMGPFNVIYRLVFSQPVGERAPQLPDEFIGCPNS